MEKSDLLKDQKVAKRTNKISGLRKKLLVGTLVGAGIVGSIAGIASYQFNTPQEYVRTIPGYGAVKEVIYQDHKTFTNLKSGIEIKPSDGRLYRNVRDFFEGTQRD